MAANWKGSTIFSVFAAHAPIAHTQLFFNKSYAQAQTVCHASECASVLSFILLIGLLIGPFHNVLEPYTRYSIII